MAERITNVPILLPRPSETHKGNCGKVLIVGGSRGMPGAPSLAANAALRCGAGLVRVATPEGIQLTIAQLAPCATTIPLPQTSDGLLGRYAIREVVAATANNDCIALGCGMGQSVHLQALIKTVIKECTQPIIIDADGLNNLAAAGHAALTLTAKTILTPHPGEMARLWRAVFGDEELPDDRITQAQSLAELTGAIVVLKGPGTVVTDAQRTYVNDTGNPGMATGGSGDVLTGCIAALAGMSASLSQLDTFSAAVLGVYIHGKAGDLAAKELSEIALTAVDILDFLPPAWAGHYVSNRKSD